MFLGLLACVTLKKNPKRTESLVCSPVITGIKMQQRRQFKGLVTLFPVFIGIAGSVR